MEPNCDRFRCEQATGSFLREMPLSVAWRLVVCQCQDSDETCGRMSSVLHSGTCGTERSSCLHSVTQCARGRGCRQRLGVFQSRCWSSMDPQCLMGPHTEQCLGQMNPALVLGARPECQTAFLNTVGTTLLYPCTCEGLQSSDRQRCGMIQQVFHNRTYYIKQKLDGDATTKAPSQSEASKISARISLVPLL
uniref:GDNF/GAS1 domain-containing protein n=1 Tax=Knipowitschia caucasica TaxID=637954 RepID=A0AAV2JKA2_KNICA